MIPTSPFAAMTTGVDPTFGLLLEATIKGSVVLVAVALIGLALHAGSAARRHLLWTVALATLAVLPALLAALPDWRVSTPALAWVASTQGAPMEAPALPAAGSAATRAGLPSPGHEDPRAQPLSDAAGLARDDAPSPGIGTQPASPIANPRRSPDQRSSWRALALAVWAVGALAVLGVFVLGHIALRLAVRDARPLRDRDWQDAALEAADRLRLTTPFALLQGSAYGMPVAFGLLRPRVLLPAGAQDWPAARRRSVLLHELAHVQRYDCLTQALAQIVCALYWFHPVVWWAAGRMRAERERACDDRVLAAATPACAYADHLLDVVRGLRDPQRTALGAVAFARPSQFEGRLLAVLDPRRDRGAVGPRQTVPTVLVAALALVVLAVLQPVAAPTPVAAAARSSASSAAPSDRRRPELFTRGSQAGSLEEGLAWAADQAVAQGTSRWWVGWQLEPAPGRSGGVLSDSEGIDFSELEHDSGRFTLDDLLARRSASTWDPEVEHSGGPAAALLLFSAARPGVVERVRLQSTWFVLGDEASPLFWLGPVPDAQSIAWMREAAERTQDRNLRAELVEDLAYHASSELVVPYLRGVLQRREPTDVRASAAEGLGWHPGPATVELLAHTARTDRSTEVRRRAAEALGRLRSPEAMEQLLALAGDPDSGDDVRRGAFDAIGQELAQRPAGRRERKTDVTAQPVIASTPGEPNAPEHEHPAASEPSIAIEPGDLEVQLQAVEALGRYPVEQALPRLRALANDHPNADVRGQAVEAIGRLGGPEAEAALDEIVWKSPHEQARRRAVEGIGRRLPPEQGLAKLMEIARTHPRDDTRQMAVEMLGYLDSVESIAALEEVLATSSDAEMCRRAVETLGRRDDPRVTARLDEIARTHPAVEARRQAAESLSRREPADAARRLLELARADVPEEVQRQAVESLGRLDYHVMPALVELARDHPSPEVRRQAVETMARRDPDQALPLLEQILREGDGAH